jgi:hypothetical protein
MSLALAGRATSTQAGNGEPLDGEGYYRSGTCDVDITLDCDDRFNSAIGSCRMRGAKGDEGLAVKACRDGRLVREGSLEREVTIEATTFGEITCGQGSNFCVVCETWTASGEGARSCVKIANGQSNPPGICGPFNVINGTSAMCSSELQGLRQAFSDPRLGFFIKIDASVAGNEGGKDLVLCSRSWQCIENPQPPLATSVAVQGPVGEAIIFTPACFVRSGRKYCY